MFEAIMTRLAQSPVMLVAEGQEMAFVANIQQFMDAYADLSEDQRKEMADAGYDEDFWDFDDDSFMARIRPYNVRDGVLTIPVAGSLINDFGYTFMGWVTGYDYVWKAYERGMADPEVQGIVFKVNSPGGEVSGNFDLVDYLHSLRAEKPTLAVASDHAYSAAYNIASAAGEIYVSRTGGVGSIGVVTMHIDLSEYMKKMGIGITFVHAGKHKVDGNPYEPLKPEVKKRMQSRIDGLYSIFVSSVARNRDMDEEAVRSTEALTYSAEESVEVGLADAVSSFDDAMAAFAGKLAPSDGAYTMTTKEQKPSAANSEATQEALDAARTDGFEAGKAEGHKAGVSAERERVQGILGCEAAKSRPANAINCALNTGMKVEEAEKFLANMPEEKPKAEKEEGKPKGKSHFEAAMGKDNPEITGEDLGDGGAGAEDDPAKRIMQSYASATGFKAKEH